MGGVARADEAWRALDAVIDPELDQPITELKFVRSLDVVGTDVVVHLRLPTSFCAPNFSYLMASDAKDALTALAWTRRVTVELDDHHDSDLINRGLAADAGYKGTFRHEADQDLEELRTTFRRKAHTAAMERVLTRLVQQGRPIESLGTVTIGDLPADGATHALLQRRKAIGLSEGEGDLVFVDHAGTPYPEVELPLQLRLARSTRISIEGNAHFCRGLLATRYDLTESAS
ncbi:iron-sulfur cluster assembly protein [Pseudonocardia sp. WMMC193]|uniref:iron-sulfur cluster assembly protein n=1 Tax=Pseudonocardia sp. WMMC193 TaxID=2911965 RepID=UPI001F3534E8|nr:iron-sulfur cluster assembly protein [Pseudonocardia sp. WMMC193]MCF7553714.1 iron-sulfur cluster assembly protein [Pseudonocardia sp. WMMC193]